MKNTVNMLRFSLKQSGLIETWLADQYVIGLMCIFCEKKVFMSFCSCPIQTNSGLYTSYCSIKCLLFHCSFKHRHHLGKMYTLARLLQQPRWGTFHIVAWANPQFCSGIRTSAPFGRLSRQARRSEDQFYPVFSRDAQGVLRTSSIPCPHGTHKAFWGPLRSRVLTERAKRNEDQFFSVSSLYTFGLQTESLRTVGCVHFVCCTWNLSKTWHSWKHKQTA